MQKSFLLIHLHNLNDISKLEEFVAFFLQKLIDAQIKRDGRINFVDFIEKDDVKNFPLIFFAVVDHNRKSRIVAFAIVACERLVILDVFLEHFKNSIKKKV